MKIVEIFRSIQGEGTQAGRPCTFVRLGGCNLRCTWCDTPYAQANAGEDRTVEQAVGRVLALGDGLACVTGGEPLLQPEAPDLVRALLASGLEVQIMTNGSLPLNRVPREAILAVDIKTPWSHALPAQATAPRTDDECPAGLPGPPHFDPSNLSRLSRTDEAKFVVRDRREFDWASRWAVSVGLFDRLGTVFAGTAWGSVEPGEVADWILASGLPFRLNLQWHKVLWGSGTRR